MKIVTREEKGAKKTGVIVAIAVFVVGFLYMDESERHKAPVPQYC